MMPLLKAENLHFSYPQKNRSCNKKEAVAGVDISLETGEAFGVVGQSGAGKTTLARLLLGLMTPDQGIVHFSEHPISRYPESKVRPLRRHFQAVFQDPSSSLDPRLLVKTIVAEPLIAHQIGTPAQRRERVRELIQIVGLPKGAESRYPSEFSGGERQRVAIARALAPNPQLLILDEPVSSLDVLVQARILGLVSELRHRFKLTLVLIAHDLEIVREVCEKAAVMQHGIFVETGATQSILNHPNHPYTRTLLEAARTDSSR